MWDKISKFFTGGNIVSELNEVAKTWFQTPEDRNAFLMKVKEFEHNRALEVQKIALEQDAEFNRRIKDLEGTAKDLLASGWPGRVVLFLRGAQRPAWGWGVLAFDFMYFTGRIELGADGEKLLYIINLLVLGFLFGERAVKNVAPLVKDILEKRKG